MSYFTLEEALRVLKMRHEGKEIIELENPDRFELYAYKGVDYETFSKLYKIGNAKYLIYDTYVDAIVRMFSILRLY